MSIFRKRTDVHNLSSPPPFTSRRHSSGLFGSDGSSRSRGECLTKTGSVGTLYSIINRLSTAVAVVDWGMYRAPQNDKVLEDSERQPVPRHAAMDLWRKPNAFMTRHELVEVGQQHLDLVGECFLIVVKAGRLPIELWPVRPDKIEPVPHPTKFLAGYVYTDPDGQKVPLGVDDVIHIKVPNPLDPYRGLGPVQAILTELDASQYTAQWNRNFFLNSARPGGLIEVERRLSDEEFDEMAARWREQHQGVANAHRVAIIEQGKWVENAFTMRDMEFPLLRQVSRDTIMEAFGVSKPMMGITDDVNRANAEASIYMFARYQQVPRLQRWREALNHRLLPMFGTTASGIEFDYRDPVAQDSEQAAIDRDSRILSVQTLAAMPGFKFDMEALLDAYDLPQVPFEEIDLQAQALELATAAPPEPAQDGQSRPDASPGGAGPQQKPKPANVRAEADLSGLARDWRSELDALLADWDDVAAEQRAELREQIAAAVDALATGEITAGALSRLAELAVDAKRAVARVLQSLVNMWNAAAERASREALGQGARVNPAGVDAAHLRDLATAVATAEANRLAQVASREAMRRAGAGKSGEQVAREVDQHLRDLKNANLEAAFGAVLHGTTNHARVSTWADGPVASIYADETLDKNTCSPCREVDGQLICTSDDLTKYYQLYTSIGGYLFCHGNQRCRGTVVPRWDLEGSP